jgi:hypothetical protein
MILAVAAPEVAPCGCDRESPGPGIEMKEGFFLYGINMVGTGEPVDKGIQGAVLILPHTTETPFPLVNFTMMATKKTVDLLVVQPFVKKGFFHGAPAFSSLTYRSSQK